MVTTRCLLQGHGGAPSPAVSSCEVRDHLLGEQAHRRGHFLVRQAAQIHVAEEMGHVPGLQVLDGGRDLRRRANGPQGFLPTALDEFRVDKGITGIRLVAPQSPRTRQGRDGGP